LKRVFSVTSTAPADWRPSAAISQRQPLGAQIATRSPRSTPEAMKARVAFSVSASSSLNVKRTSPSSSAETSGQRLAARDRVPGMVIWSHWTSVVMRIPLG